MITCETTSRGVAFRMILCFIYLPRMWPRGDMAVWRDHNVPQYNNSNIFDYNSGEIMRYTNVRCCDCRSLCGPASVSWNLTICWALLLLSLTSPTSQPPTSPLVLYPCPFIYRQERAHNLSLLFIFMRVIQSAQTNTVPYRSVLYTVYGRPLHPQSR